VAPSRAVNGWSGKCNTLSCDGPWRVDDEFVDDDDEMYDKKP